VGDADGAKKLEPLSYCKSMTAGLSHRVSPCRVCRKTRHYLDPTGTQAFRFWSAKKRHQLLSYPFALVVESAASRIQMELTELHCIAHRRQNTIPLALVSLHASFPIQYPSQARI